MFGKENISSRKQVQAGRIHGECSSWLLRVGIFAIARIFQNLQASVRSFGMSTDSRKSAVGACTVQGGGCRKRAAVGCVHHLNLRLLSYLIALTNANRIDLQICCPSRFTTVMASWIVRGILLRQGTGSDCRLNNVSPDVTKGNSIDQVPQGWFSCTAACGLTPPLSAAHFLAPHWMTNHALPALYPLAGSL